MNTRVTFIGEDIWSAQLAEGLNTRARERVTCSAVKLSERSSTFKFFKRLLSDDVIVRVGFPPPVLPRYTGDPRRESRRPRETLKRLAFGTRLGLLFRKCVLYRRLDRASRHRFHADLLQRSTRWLRPGRREILYWIGTDVLNALEAVDGPVPVPHYMERLARFESITGVDRLTEELQHIGVQATTVPYPPPTIPPVFPAPMPSRMTVLTYAPEARREFYGLPEVMNAARQLPDVDFLVMGGTEHGLDDVPANMSFLGFVEDPSSLYARSSVVVRHVRHDGAGYSMAEGLLHGRQVIYTYDVPHTICVPFGDTEGLTRVLKALRGQNASGGIPLNQAGREWALAEFDPDRRFQRLLEVLTA